MKALIYNITLNEPALMTRLEGDPNSATSYDFLPGSVLRGLFVARYARYLSDNKERTNEGHALELSERTRRLFFDGTTRYLNGYPLDGDMRSLPIPRAWHQLKTPTTETKVWRDFSKEAPSTEELKEQWKRAGEVFWVKGKNASNVVRSESLHHISIHTQRDRAAGRPRQGSGAVFRYDALATGQTFQAVILCDDSDAELLQKLIAREGLASVGGSRNAGYGHVTLAFVGEEPDWQETPVAQKTQVNDTLKITLLSDALIRDANGQFATDVDALAHTIKTRLGIDGELNRNLSFTSIGLVGGFNRKWGLPLPQAPAFEAGCVLVFEKTKAPADLDKKISQLEDAGIGERRAEGFGRVTVNWLDAKEWIEMKSDENAGSPQDKQDEPQEKIPVKQLQEGSPDHRLAQIMSNRLHEKRMSEIIKARASKISLLNPPNKSQISQLREMLQKAIIDANATKQLAENVTPADAQIDKDKKKKPPAEELKDHLLHVDKRAVTRRQFERARVSIVGDKKQSKLEAWLSNDILGCETDDKLAALLGTEAGALPAANIGGVTAKRSAADCRRFAQQLALEVMRRTNKTRGDA